MTRRLVYVFAALALSVFLAGCGGTPEQQAQRYLESGEKYFKNGKYKEASIMYRRALQKNMRFGEAYYKLGLTELKLGKFVEALRALQRSVELQPKNMDAPVKLAEMYLTIYANDPKKPQQFIKEIEDLAKRLTDNNPNSYDGLRLKGYVALTKQKPDEALDFFERADKARPGQPELALVIVSTLQSLRRFDEAETRAKAMLAKERSYAPLYDILYQYYMREKRVDDAEKTFVAKASNNPKVSAYQLQLAGHYFLQNKRDDMQVVLDRLLKNPKDFPRARLDVGEFYFRIREYQQSLEQFELGAKENPRESSLYKRRQVEALVMQGKKTEASQLVESILKDDPKDNEAISMRAALMLQAGTREQIQQAINDLQMVVSRQPENHVLRFNLARALIAKGDWDAARVQLQEALKQRPDHSLSRLALAQVYVAKNDFANALETANQILKAEPNNLPARLFKTSAQIGMREFDQAATDLNAMLAQNPRISDAQFQLATVQMARKQFAEAESTLRQFRKDHPTDPRGLGGLVESMLLQDKTEPALTMLKAELERAPDRSDIRGMYATTALKAKRFDLAKGEFQTLVDKNPKSTDLLLAFGTALREMGDYEGARAQFVKARALSPNEVGPYLNEAIVYEKQGKYKEALPVYREILKRDPDNPVALNNVAYMMAESGAGLDEALSLANRALQKVPNSLDIADTVGWIYIKKNLSDNAIQIFRDLTAKNPEKSTYHYHLGMALFQKGDRPGAKRSLEAALTKRPDKDEESKIKELIAKCG